MRSRLLPLLRIFYSPARAMAELQSQAPYLTGAVIALAGALLLNLAAGGLGRLSPAAGEPGAVHPSIPIIQLFRLVRESAAPVLFLGFIFVPACLLAASIVERRASFRVLLRQEYAPLVSCVLYGWGAACLVIVIPGWLVFGGSLDGASLRAAYQLIAIPYFVFLSILAVRTVLRLSYGRAIATVVLSGLSLLALPLAQGFVFLLSSPLLAILVIFILINVFGEAISSQRARESFKRNLEIATLNPADASAHYNLGLIYLGRGQYDEAKSSFQRAVDIDATEVDAHYQLGRIARQEASPAEAIQHFESVVAVHPEHSQGEVWREIGRTYLDAGQLQDARAAFERFIGRRPSDAEGRYHYGLTLERLGLPEEASAQMKAVIEAVRTSPSYKYRSEKQWMGYAESFLRSRSG